MSKRDFLTFVFLLAMFFLFGGKPDLWDAMHAYAMAYFKVMP